MNVMKKQSDISVKVYKRKTESFSVGWISRIMDKNKQVNYKQKMENFFIYLNSLNKIIIV